MTAKVELGVATEMEKRIRVKFRMASPRDHLWNCVVWSLGSDIKKEDVTILVLIVYEKNVIVVRVKLKSLSHFCQPYQNTSEIRRLWESSQSQTCC